MTSALQEIRAEFVRIYEDLVQVKGLPRIFGRIMAIFLIEGRELSHKEVSKLTGYSISSVSRTLGQMVRMGIIHKHKDTLQKQFVYHVDFGFRQLAISAFEVQLRAYERHLNEVQDLVRISSALKSRGEEKAEIAHLKSMLREFSKTMQQILEIIKKLTIELKNAP